jgi:hypothetical protein
MPSRKRLITLAKKQKYIKKLHQRIKLAYQRLKDRIKLIHGELSKADKSQGEVSAYELMYQWLVDVCYYGFLLTIVYVNLFIIHGWLKYIMFVFSLGAARWLVLDIIEKITRIIKG